MKRARWVVLGLVLTGAGLLFLFTRNSGQVEQDGAPPEPAVVADSQPAIVAPDPPAPSARPAKEGEVFNHLQVIVQDEAGRPLEGAEVRTVLKGETSTARLTNVFATTARGIAPVVWPAQTLERFELTASKDEYGSRKMAWDMKTGDVLPPTYTVTLKSGVHMGGFVVDPEGNPLEGATVSLSRFWRGGEERQSKGEEPSFTRQNHTTRADGRWTTRDLPIELLDRIHVEGSHTNFISVMVWIEGKPQIEQELRAGTHKLALKRGLEVRGRVIDEQQQPIANAQVWAGRRNFRDRQETRSDGQGRFTFRNVNGTNVVFSVMASGYEPDSKSVSVVSATEEIVLQLAKGSVIRGLVQNQAGEPIEGVRASLESGPGPYGENQYEFSTQTGSDGRFEWSSAPNKPLSFYFGKTGYEQRRRVSLNPNEENIVTMRLSRQVHGQVLDAQTGQPIKRFRIAVGRNYARDRFSADSGSAKEFASEEGFFTTEVHEEGSDAIQASADDYTEQSQVLPKTDDSSARIVFQLKPSAALKGVVTKPDGQPVSGASVALADDKGRTVMFSNGRLRGSGSQSKVVTTDAAGRFSIPSPPENGTVIAANSDGFASVSLPQARSSGVLILQPYGRIEGVLLKGGEPGAGQDLMLSSPTRGISFQGESYRMTTDAGGRFAFENVPAGTFSIVRLVPTSSRSWMHSHRTDVEVSPGQTIQVALGGVDGTVRGRIRFETELQEKTVSLSAQLSTITPEIPKTLSPEERSAYLNSPEWLEQTKNRKSYSATISPDGSLLLDSVAPGEYKLRVTAGPADDDSLTRKAFAQSETTVTIPVGVDPTTPIDIGEVVLTPVATAQRQTGVADRK